MLCPLKEMMSHCESAAIRDIFGHKGTFFLDELHYTESKLSLLSVIRSYLFRGPQPNDTHAYKVILFILILVILIDSAISIIFPLGQNHKSRSHAAVLADSNEKVIYIGTEDGLP